MQSFTLQNAVAGPLDTPTGAVLAEAKQLVKEMIDNPRGPYSRIRWYCNDGTTLPPKASACQPHGGGIQHAEYSDQRTRLAKLGWSVGTIFAPLKFEQLKNQSPRDARLRELPLERYLTDIDDGWVLRKAQDYRGRAQIEDEVASGQRLLIDAVSDNAWLLENYLLVRELARVIPHGEETDLSRSVRRLAIELAESDPTAERWRAEVHSNPTLLTSKRLRTWAQGLANKPSTENTKLIAFKLADDLDTLYGETGRRERLGSQLKQLKSAASAAWRSDTIKSLSGDRTSKIAGLCQATASARREVLTTLPNKEKLLLIDALSAIETEVRMAFMDAPNDTPTTRAALLKVTHNLLECVYGAGLISPGELASAVGSLALSNGDTSSLKGYQPSLKSYQNTVAQLKRVPNWAAGNVRYAFAEALVNYGALDGRAVRFTDDLLRGSPLWLMGDVLKKLSQDVAVISGNEVNIANQSVSSAIALNPGMARGILRIYETLDAAENGTPAATDIVALPETIAELKPVAGILTLGEGNALSHVQLLARNFGIPNVAVDFPTIDIIKPLEGQEVVLIVSSDGNVVLKLASQIDNIEQLFPAKDKREVTQKISVPPANLVQKDLLTINQISRQMSGKVIGPKAANLGELNRLFPGKVAPALAIPFGIYNDHLNRLGITDRIRAAYASQAANSITPEALNKELASIHQAIEALELAPQTKQQLDQAMRQEFGESGSYGVFIRSDTNVEDLPQFTGAGLSETLANVTGEQNIFRGIPKVWASVLSPRAIAWRSSLLKNPEQIYASVLVMKSVASEKSGVLVTANLADSSQPGLTVSTAWGVGGAVSGEAAEGLVILPNGTTSLISEAKTPYQRALSKQGGVDWLPARSGGILTLGDIAQLQELAAEVNRKYEVVLDEAGKPRPWDIEFGFVEGKLTLFQIRPLVEKNTQRANVALKTLMPNASRPQAGPKNIDLSKPILGSNSTDEA